jgi:probable rRNA maturation factor
VASVDAASAPVIEVRRSGTRARAPARRELQRWTVAALGRRAARCELSVLLVGERQGRELNARYRGKDYATNVLSFPAGAAASTAADAAAAASTALGDLVICPTVVSAEARAQGKLVRAHWAHLFIHGLLHLLGYDHERRADAARMERREISVLRRLGIANPYVVH